MNQLTELDVLRDVIIRLENTNIDYMLTGSLAMNYYAQPRMTRDIDIVAAIDVNDIERILEIFAVEYYISGQSVADAVRNATMFNLVHLESVVKVDVIVRKAGEFRQHEFNNRLKVQIADFSTWIVSKEDLILSKLCWANDTGSEMQLMDIRNLLGSDPDITYLRQWAGTLGVQDLLEQCLHE